MSNVHKNRKSMEMPREIAYRALIIISETEGIIQNSRLMSLPPMPLDFESDNVQNMQKTWTAKNIGGSPNTTNGFPLQLSAEPSQLNRVTI